DADTSTVHVGPRDVLVCRWAEVAAPTWTTGAVPSGPVRVQIRAHGATVPGRVEPAAASVRIHLDEPVHGLAIGQAAVVYDARDAVCLGGGRVTRADRPAGLPVV